MRRKMKQKKAISTRGRGTARSIQEGIVRMPTNTSTRVTPRTENPDTVGTSIALQKMRCIGVPSQGIDTGMMIATLIMKSITGHIGTEGNIALVLNGNTRKSEIRVNRFKVT
jgi:hypothetical protein